MTCVSIFEQSDGTWTLYQGMDPVQRNKVADYDNEDAAMDAAKDKNKDVILVIEQGEIGGYTRKYEKSWPGYEEV